jgi:hypothetical protein
MAARVADRTAGREARPADRNGKDDVRERSQLRDAASTGIAQLGRLDIIVPRTLTSSAS